MSNEDTDDTKKRVVASPLDLLQEGIHRTFAFRFRFRWFRRGRAEC